MQLKTKKKINEITERRRYKYKYIIGKKDKEQLDNKWQNNKIDIYLIFCKDFLAEKTDL